MQSLENKVMFTDEEKMDEISRMTNRVGAVLFSKLMRFESEQHRIRTERHDEQTSVIRLRRSRHPRKTYDSLDREYINILSLIMSERGSVSSIV